MGRMSALSPNTKRDTGFYADFPGSIGGHQRRISALSGGSGYRGSLAEKDGEAVGFHMYDTASPGIMTPDDAVELCVAGTLPGYRRCGVGQSMMNAGCRMMREKGYRYITTDWRITNLASSTFWPKSGFQPLAYRMARVIDPNYAWANLSNPCMQQF